MFFFNERIWFAAGKTQTIQNSDNIKSLNSTDECKVRKSGIFQKAPARNIIKRL